MSIQIEVRYEMWQDHSYWNADEITIDNTTELSETFLFHKNAFGNFAHDLPCLFRDPFH